MTIDLIRLHRLSIPLVRPFRTSFGTESVRDVILVEAVTSDGVSGWGECVTMSWPGYSYEYGNGAVAVITEHLLPARRPSCRPCRAGGRAWAPDGEGRTLHRPARRVAA